MNSIVDLKKYRHKTIFIWFLRQNILYSYFKTFNQSYIFLTYKNDPSYPAEIISRKCLGNKYLQ